MKNQLLLTLSVLLMLGLLSCGSKPQNVGQIAVFGEATNEIDPDEILISVRLREFYTEEAGVITSNDQLRTLGPSIMELESAFVMDLAALGIDQNQISLNSAGQSPVWITPRGGNNSSGFNTQPMLFRDYTVQVTNIEEANKVLNVILTFGSTINLSEVRYSKMEELRIITKQQALANAHIRAESLAKGYGKIVGLVFVSDDQSRIIQQQGDTGFAKARRASAPTISDANVVMEMANNDTPQPVALRKISVRHSVDAVFAIR
jgi:uncharacterized protein YggE